MEYQRIQNVANRRDIQAVLAGAVGIKQLKKAGRIATRTIPHGCPTSYGENNILYHSEPHP